MQSAVVLRPYRREDLDELFALDVTCFAPPFRFSRAAMKRFAEARNAHTLVAERLSGDLASATLAGFLIVQIEGGADARSGYVVTFDVAPEERRTGVGTQLMEAGESIASRAGAQWMYLHVFTGNAGAIRFYEGRGYIRMGVEEGFYGTEDGMTLDAFLYQKDLTPAQ